jgi:hypothetical protein
VDSAEAEAEEAGMAVSTRRTQSDAQRLQEMQAGMKEMLQEMQLGIVSPAEAVEPAAPARKERIPAAAEALIIPIPPSP